MRSTAASGSTLPRTPVKLGINGQTQRSRVTSDTSSNTGPMTDSSNSPPSHGPSPTEAIEILMSLFFNISVKS